MSPPPTRRVVVADDSRLMRRLIADALEREGLDVVAQAEDGDQALAACRAHRPDAMTLDLAMPGLDGLGVLRKMSGENLGVKVVVVSATANGTRAVEALEQGAFELVSKPAVNQSFPEFASGLVKTLHAACERRKRLVPPPGSPMRRATDAPQAPRPSVRPRSGAKRLVVIASSTGGPRALADLVPNLRAPLGAGGLIVQHMPPGFTASLAQRLNGTGALGVAEAATGDRLDPGKILIAPGGSHLRLDGTGKVTLTDTEPIGALRPRADLTIADAAKHWGPATVLVVLTGMGADGLEGARAVHARGGKVIVEAESTCTVYGMPRVIAEAGLADEVLPLDQIARAVHEEVA